MDLEIEYPGVRCSDCGFTAPVHGKWSVEDGRLVFRAESDPFTGRGPDLDGCGESHEYSTTVGVVFEWGQEPLPEADVAALRRTARHVSHDEDCYCPTCADERIHGSVTSTRV